VQAVEQSSCEAKDVQPVTDTANVDTVDEIDGDLHRIRKSLDWMENEVDELKLEVSKWQNSGETAAEKTLAEKTDAGLLEELETYAADLVGAESEETRSEAKTTQTPKRDPVTPLDIFSWVRHITIPPGCTLPAGSEFTKTWRVTHFASGTEYTFDTVRLVHQSQGQLGEACKVIKEFKRQDIVEDDEVEISIEGLRVPPTRGVEVVEHWRFEDENGVPYGQPLRLRFTVERSDSGSSSLMSSAVIMPGTDGSLVASTVREEAIVPGPVNLSDSAIDVYRSGTPSIDDDATSVISLDSSVSVTSFVDVECHHYDSDPSLPATDEEEILRDEFDFMDEAPSEDERVEDDF